MFPLSKLTLLLRLTRLTPPLRQRWRRRNRQNPRASLPSPCRCRRATSSPRFLMDKFRPLGLPLQLSPLLQLNPLLQLSLPLLRPQLKDRQRAQSPLHQRYRQFLCPCQLATSSRKFQTVKSRLLGLVLQRKSRQHRPHPHPPQRTLRRRSRLRLSNRALSLPSPLCLHLTQLATALCL